MAKLKDKLYNRVIEGKLQLESGDDITKAVEESLKDSDLNVKSINAKGGAISGPLAVTGNSAIGGDLDVNGDARVKTLSQSQANWSLNLSEVEPTIPSGFSATNIFARLQVINQELELVLSFTITNNGESTASPANIQFGEHILPEAIGAKLIDIKGNNLNTTESGYCPIAGAVCTIGTSGVSSSTFSKVGGVLNVIHRGTKLFIAVYDLPNIGAGASMVFSGRIQLTLL